MTSFPLVKEGPLREALDELEQLVQTDGLTANGLETRVPEWIASHGHQGANTLLVAVLEVDGPPTLRCMALRGLARIALAEGRRSSARVYFMQAREEVAGDPVALCELIGDMLDAL
ncbi:MAG: hypothetical protein KC766_27025 [Myxococcales bacterium]|nr:hypothetical protein [Myxococcales bacterium]